MTKFDLEFNLASCADKLSNLWSYGSGSPVPGRVLSGQYSVTFLAAVLKWNHLIISSHNVSIQGDITLQLRWFNINLLVKDLDLPLAFATGRIVACHDKLFSTSAQNKHEMATRWLFHWKIPLKFSIDLLLWEISHFRCLFYILMNIINMNRFITLLSVCIPGKLLIATNTVKYTSVSGYPDRKWNGSQLVHSRRRLYWRRTSHFINRKVAKWSE